jgi:hypothetical protein
MKNTNEIQTLNVNIQYKHHPLNNGGTIIILDKLNQQSFKLSQENGVNIYVNKDNTPMTKDKIQHAIKLHDMVNNKLLTNSRENTNLEYFDEILNGFRKDAGMEEKDYYITEPRIRSYKQNNDGTWALLTA